MFGVTVKTNQFESEVICFVFGVTGRQANVATTSVWVKSLMQQLSVQTACESDTAHHTGPGLEMSECDT